MSERTTDGTGGKTAPEREAARQQATGASSPGTARVLHSAREAIEALTGLEAETVSSVARDEDGGWKLQIEVVELRKIPDSVSMLGSYEMTLDAEGELTGYRRLRRYERGKADPR
ncbi:gas vesicle protein [Streptomyces albus subsp. chlorinus]|uniref:gas vesicle protein GvpO n=1 Tax=Streptomyces albus TaxID=1888 RepID=UPI00156F1F71|nr:gas vesicle protein [Streptomyces albus]NSC20819.1 gas vesicle protein [Streptomyces albus subsp. chlorinus]